MYCQRDPLFAGKVIKVPIHLGFFYCISVMWNEKLTVAVENVCVQNSKGTVKDYFHYSLKEKFPLISLKSGFCQTGLFKS